MLVFSGNLLTINRSQASVLSMDEVYTVHNVDPIIKQCCRSIMDPFHSSKHSPKTKTTIGPIFYWSFLYLLDHFLQPKDNNTQHKLKISHLIVYNFSSSIIFFTLSV